MHLGFMPHATLHLYVTKPNRKKKHDMALQKRALTAEIHNLIREADTSEAYILNPGSINPSRDPIRTRGFDFHMPKNLKPSN